MAHATVAQLHGWQPNPEHHPSSVLEAAEAVALGRDAEPGVLWSWRQGEWRFQSLLKVLDFIDAVAYEEHADPPSQPSAADWVPLIMLSVFEPHGEPPDAPPGARWCLDYLP